MNEQEIVNLLKRISSDDRNAEDAVKFAKFAEKGESTPLGKVVEDPSVADTLGLIALAMGVRSAERSEKQEVRETYDDAAAMELSRNPLFKVAVMILTHIIVGACGEAEEQKLKLSDSET